MKAFSLDHLKDTEFEEFCFDLLNAMGATHMTWRKGTGFESSPADQGRDIECCFGRKEIDGHTPEKWFVECKHYKQGVPLEKIQGILTAASSERPDVVLIVVSNFLSNSAKNALESYQRNNKPPFRIKIWERPDLERFTLGKPLVMRKYGLGGEFEFLNILHPAHVHYLRTPPVNSLDYFFGIIDRLDPTERKKFFYGAFLFVINPQFDQPSDMKRQSLGDLAREKINYSEFRTKCYKLAPLIAPHLLIQSVVFHELSATFICADKTNIQQVRENMKRSLAFFEEELVRPNRDTEALSECIRQTKESIEDIQERTDKNYENYCSFCDKVVAPLFEERHPMPDWIAKQMAEDKRLDAEEKARKRQADK